MKPTPVVWFPSLGREGALSNSVESRPEQSPIKVYRIHVWLFTTVIV